MTDQAPNTERPAWLPEKFQSPEALAQAYAALETKLGSTSQPQTPATQTNPLQIQPPAQPAQKLKMEQYRDEFLSTGKLSDQSYASLEASGLDRAFVDSYIAGQSALISQTHNAAHQTAGGKEAYEKMIQWASAGNLTPSEAQAFNAAVNGSPEMVSMAVSFLKQKYTAANGNVPQLQNGGSAAPQAGVIGFRNSHEVVAAMSDPRYGKDPSYTADVAKRLEISNVF